MTKTIRKFDSKDAARDHLSGNGCAFLMDYVSGSERWVSPRGDRIELYYDRRGRWAVRGEVVR